MRAAEGRAAHAAPLALVEAAHIFPALAVTVLTGLLAAAADLDIGRMTTVTAAVLAGQLTIGWVNDLVDTSRDRRVGRTDKPLATGVLSTRMVVVALALAAVACVVLSASSGWRSGLVNVALVVGAGQAYNLGLKATAWSWAPYAVAFGTLPAVVTLAEAPPEWPPAWMLGAGAALGIAAHFLNVLPDLADDAATGVRGLPHRLGARGSRLTATVLLLAASGLTVLGPAGAPPLWAWLALVATAALAVVVVRGRGEAPFRAAVAIAVVDVALLVAVSR